jgi:hypothetical protein
MNKKKLLSWKKKREIEKFNLPNVFGSSLRLILSQIVTEKIK